MDEFVKSHDKEVVLVSSARRNGRTSELISPIR